MDGWLDDVCLAVRQGGARSLISGAYRRNDLTGGFMVSSCRLGDMNRRPLSGNGNGVVNVVLWVIPITFSGFGSVRESTNLVVQSVSALVLGARAVVLP